MKRLCCEEDIRVLYSKSETNHQRPLITMLFKKELLHLVLNVQKCGILQIFSFMTCHQIFNTMDATSWAETIHASGAREFNPFFLWSSCCPVVFCVVICRSLFVFALILFYYSVRPSSIYDCWLSLWYIQIVLTTYYHSWASCVIHLEI